MCHNNHVKTVKHMIFFDSYVQSRTTKMYAQSNSVKKYKRPTEEPPEGYSGREAGEVDEEEHRETLEVEGVSEVTRVLWVAPSQIVDQTPEQSLGSLERIAKLVRRVTRVLWVAPSLGSLERIAKLVRRQH